MVIAEVAGTALKTSPVSGGASHTVPVLNPAPIEASVSRVAALRDVVDAIGSRVPLLSVEANVGGAGVLVRFTCNDVGSTRTVRVALFFFTRITFESFN